MATDLKHQEVEVSSLRIVLKQLLYNKKQKEFISLLKKQITSIRVGRNINLIINKKEYECQVPQIFRYDIISWIKSEDIPRLYNVLFKLISQQLSRNKKNQSLGTVLGGGCGSSQVDNAQKKKIIESNLKGITKKKLKSTKLNQEFECSYKDLVQNQNYKNEMFDGGYQIAAMHEVVEKCIYNPRRFIMTEIDIYRAYIIEIYDIVLQYMVSGIKSEVAIKEDIQLFEIQINSFQSYLRENQKTGQCLDLIFLTQFILDLNNLRVGIDELNKSQIVRLAEIVISVIKVGINISTVIKNPSEIIFSLKNVITESTKAFKQLENVVYVSFTANNSEKKSGLINRYFQNKQSNITYLMGLWMKKAQLIADQGNQYQLEDEINLYINEYLELSQVESSDGPIMYVLTQINYLLEKGILSESNLNRDKTLKRIANNLSLNNEKVSQFIESLQKKYGKRNSMEVVKRAIYLSAKNTTYRFLTFQILLKYNILLSYQDQVSTEDKDNFWINLCYSFIVEKEESVKIIFQCDSDFVNRVNQRVSENPQEVSKKVMKEQQQRNKDQVNVGISPEDIQQFQYQIKDKNDFLQKVSLDLIDNWQLQARKRLVEDIAFKDDALLEVQDLYIDQNLSYLAGNKSFNNKQVDQNELQVQRNAIEDIINIFILPNLNDEKTQNTNQFKILGILAEGGTGKSMLIKRLETLIIKEKNSFNNKYGRLKSIIPLLIKCNSLDQQLPSLEDYLLEQNQNKDIIKILKESSVYKLILLDGYDEYAGEQFRVYTKLRISEWKNTIIIVTSRKEKLTTSDAQAYFSLDDDLGKRDESSYCILQLKEFQRKDVDQYCKKFFEKQHKINDQGEINQIKYEKDLFLMKECLNNSELENLLFLPINLFLFTRMVVNLKENELREVIQNIDDQIQIQEVFFQEQFKREALGFLEQIKSEISNKELVNQVATAYFEYFQEIAMRMFVNKGIQSNYLQLKKDQIKFKTKQQLLQISKKDQEQLLFRIKNYINSKIITKVYIINEIELHQQQDNFAQISNNQIIEFKHKSLFEYFVARAMKFDFDIHKENIYRLSMVDLKNFNINQEMIMNPGYNKSEQQILIKLYQLIELDRKSGNVDYTNNYNCDKIEDNNRYIQYIRSSRIESTDEISPIDKGSSNMLSVLFVNKFSFDELTITQCSLSKVYISGKHNKNITFDRCNLSDAFLKKTHPSSFETSNTLNATFSSYFKVFDTDNIYNFTKITFIKSNTLISINDQGYINSFKVDENKKYLAVQKSKKLTNIPLKEILLFGINKQVVVSGGQTLFLLDCNNFNLISIKKFKNEIINIDCQNNQCLIQLKSQENYYGNFEKGFEEIQIKGQMPRLSKNGELIITQNENQMIIYKINEHFKMINTIEGNIGEVNSVAFSADGKYLATCSSNKTCKIWNIEKRFQLINTIDCHNELVRSITFSGDGKYLVTGLEDTTCKIWNAQKEFKLVNTISCHKNKVISVAFSQDSKYLATCSYDKTCKIMNTEKGFIQINTIEGHSSRIRSVAFSANGKYFATGSEDKTCKIWNTQKGFELIKIIEGHNSYILSVTFSADGKYLATGSQDKTCKIWNAQNGFELIQTIEGHENDVTSVIFAANGKQLATGSNDKTCKIWNAQKGFQLLNIIEGHSAEIFSVAFSADGKYLATGSADKTCKIWNAEKGFQLMNKIEAHSAAIFQVVFSADGKYMATGSQDQACKIWNVEKGFELMYTIVGDNKQVMTIAFSVDSKQLVTGSNDETCKIWNAEKGFELMNSIEGHIGQLRSVNFSADGKYLATGSDDRTFKIWNSDKGFELINIIEGHNSQILSVTFSADGKYLATGSQDMTCKIWNAKKGFELMQTIEGHNEKVNSIAFSPDGKYLATGSYDMTCKIWNVEKGFELIKTIDGYASWINTVTFSTNGKYLATGTLDDLCQIWNVEKMFELIITIEEHTSSVESVAFSVDDKYLATGSMDRTCKIWNLQRGFDLMKTITFNDLRVISIAFSSNGKYLAIGYQFNFCNIWNVEKGFQLINSIQVGLQGILSVAFSQNGKYLAGSQQKTCMIWDAEQGFELMNTIESHTDLVFSVSFSANGKYLATGSQDNICKIWNTKIQTQEMFQCQYII